MSDAAAHSAPTKKAPPWGWLTFAALAMVVLYYGIPLVIPAVMGTFAKYFGAFIMAAILAAIFKWITTWMGARKASAEAEHH